MSLSVKRSSGRPLELCRQEGESAVGLDRHGHRHSANYCIPRGGSQSPERASFVGGRFPRGIKCRPRSILIVSKPTRGSFPQRNTELSPSWHARPITSNASTAHYDNESPGWCAPHYRSRRNWPVISGLSSTSLTITTSPDVQPYLDSTTRL